MTHPQNTWDGIKNRDTVRKVAERSCGMRDLEVGCQFPVSLPLTEITAFNISFRSCLPLQVLTGFVRYHFNGTVELRCHDGCALLFTKDDHVASLMFFHGNHAMFAPPHHAR